MVSEVRKSSGWQVQVYVVIGELTEAHPKGAVEKASRSDARLSCLNQLSQKDSGERHQHRGLKLQQQNLRVHQCIPIKKSFALDHRMLSSPNQNPTQPMIILNSTGNIHNGPFR